MEAIQTILTEYLAPKHAEEAAQRLEPILAEVANKTAQSIISAAQGVLSTPTASKRKTAAPRAMPGKGKKGQAAAKTKGKAKTGGSKHLSPAGREQMRLKKKLYWAEKRIAGGKASAEDKAFVKEHKSALSANGNGKHAAAAKKGSKRKASASAPATSPALQM